MKRPRRPTKRKVAPKKVVKRKTTVSRNKIIRDIREALDVTKDGKFDRVWQVVPDLSAVEAAVFDIPKPPPGFSYQWSPVVAAFRMELKGWSRVPFSRHPEIGKPQNFDGYIVYRDMALFQIAADLAEAIHHGHRQRAIAQRQGIGDDVMQAMAGYSDPSIRHGHGIPILSEAFLTSADYTGPENPGDAVVELAVKFLMPGRWRDAAAALRLDDSEYVRRRILMEGTLLSAQTDGTFAVVKLTTEKTED